MKYFTPDLYLRFNSFDIEEAERADETWTQVEEAYRERLASIRGTMPSPLRMLSKLCLHDALVASRIERVEPIGPVYPGMKAVPVPFLWSAVGIVSVTTGAEVVTLFYTLNDHMVTHEAPQGWRFSKDQEHWLYDEVDRIDDREGGFVHRILFSTGITLEIPFSSVIIHRFTIPTAASWAKQSA